MTERSLFQGRPRPSCRLLGFWDSGSRIIHCSSVKSRAWQIRDLVPRIISSERTLPPKAQGGQFPQPHSPQDGMGIV
jgi:hypothetical protein